MTWLAVSIALATGRPPEPSLPNWRRLVTTQRVHVGVAPALDVTATDWDLGVTVQVTVDAL